MNYFKNEIENYVNECLGFLVMKIYNEEEKPLTNSEIKILSKYFRRMALYVTSLETDVYDYNKNMVLHAKLAVANYEAPIGNCWSSFCNVNKKLDCFDIDCSVNGMSNPDATMQDQRLKDITDRLVTRISI